MFVIIGTVSYDFDLILFIFVLFVHSNQSSKLLTIFIYIIYYKIITCFCRFSKYCSILKGQHAVRVYGKHWVYADTGHGINHGKVHSCLIN